MLCTWTFGRFSTSSIIYQFFVLFGHTLCWQFEGFPPFCLCVSHGNVYTMYIVVLCRSTSEYQNDGSSPAVRQKWPNCKGASHY